MFHLQHLNQFHSHCLFFGTDVVLGMNQKRNAVHQIKFTTIHICLLQGGIL